MPLLVGIDEAGYGPVLGPLVVAATVWSVPPDGEKCDLWDRLAPVVARGATAETARLPVGDSKQIFDRKRGICTLERTVLAFAAAAGVAVDQLDLLLSALGATPDSPLPWYRELARPLPIDRHRSAFDGVASRLTANLSETTVRCLALRAAVVTEDRFNRRVAATRNKSAVVIEEVLRHMTAIAATAGDHDVYFKVDRLGGRIQYRPLLQEAFPDRHVHEIEVSDARSAYRLAGSHSDWFMTFEIDADQLHLPVALASMIAKYTREALMLEFNRYWQRHAAALRPTAGYYQDAQRFSRDIAPILADAGLTWDEFARAR